MQNYRHAEPQAADRDALAAQWLQDHIEFDGAFEVSPDGAIADVDCPPYIGTVQHSNKNDIEIDGIAPRHTAWMPLSGLTGQDRYSGAVMHPSEYISEGVARRLRQIAQAAGRPVLFALAIVEADTVLAGDRDEPVGWTILQRMG